MSPTATPTVLVTGASRGLGLEFVRQYLDDGWRVHATCRDLSRCGGLCDLPGERLSIHSLEVAEKSSIERLASEIGSTAIDVLVCNAGVIGPRGMNPESVDRDSWIETFAVNAIAPLAVAGAFRRNLIKGRQKKAVAISSRLGSISLNESGGQYAYRSSKAALNAVWHSLALDWAGDGMSCITVHPGWVRTDMGGAQADIEPRESVAGIRRVIERLTPAESGRFFNYDGEELPW